MSEPIGMDIQIGGDLPASLIEDFLTAMKEDIYETTGPTTEKELRSEVTGKKAIKWYGLANYGECDELKAFCVKHKLGYIHHCEATGEYDATIAYWVPGMKEEESGNSTQSGDRMVDVDKIKPYTDFLLDYATMGKDALPLYVGNEKLAELIEKCMKKPAKTLEIIRKKFQTLLPGEPVLPPLTIKE